MAFLQAIRASRATGTGLGVLGMFWGGFAALMPDWQARSGVSDGTLGLLLLLSAVGGMGAMGIGPRLQGYLGHRSIPVFAVQLGLVGLVGWTIGSPLVLGLVLLWCGWSLASLDIAVNVEISHREAATGLSLMNWNHALFSFGLAAAAALAGLARHSGASPGEIMAATGIVVVCAAWAMREPSSAVVEDLDHETRKATLPWAAVIPAGVILFCSFVAENATESWSALHLQRSFDAPPGSGAAGPMMMGLMMGVGRVFGQILAQRLGEMRLVAISVLIGAGGALLTAFAPVQVLAVAGVAMIGLGAAVIVPSANSLLGARTSSRSRAMALSRAWLIGFTGYFIGPVVMGAIAEGAGLRAAFGAIALILLVILPGLARLARVPQE
ncbi:MFS transporter [Thioclava atlantica]|uniref:Major facilitator superfamily protein n=1 Tax=Thioclava atlantica TaxID=1317124 RepID=A0A085U0X3_9RHOB|nr:MFS transporter [Thioclava atlantica]KFE36620.1 major facilitator superfamily protein [Thioclava atlantica]